MLGSVVCRLRVLQAGVNTSPLQITLLARARLDCGVHSSGALAASGSTLFAAGGMSEFEQGMVEITYGESSSGDAFRQGGCIGSLVFSQPGYDTWKSHGRLFLDNSCSALLRFSSRRWLLHRLRLRLARITLSHFDPYQLLYLRVSSTHSQDEDGKNVLYELRGGQACCTRVRLEQMPNFNHYELL